MLNYTSHSIVLNIPVKLSLQSNCDYRHHFKSFTPLEFFILPFSLLFIKSIGSHQFSFSHYDWNFLQFILMESYHIYALYFCLFACKYLTS